MILSLPLPQQHTHQSHSLHYQHSFGYLLVFADAECKVIGTFPNLLKYDEDITFVVTASGKEHDHPILLNIWHTADKVTSMERYEYSEHNLNEILRYFKGEISKVRLSEEEELGKSVSEILEHADAVMI